MPDEEMLEAEALGVSSDECDSQCDAYRAAGQAYAATVLGLPIRRVSIRGIVLDWPANRSATWDQQRAEVAMGLLGIAVVSRCCFGTAPGGSVPFIIEGMTARQRDDWDTVQTITAEIDPRDEHRVLRDAWNLAAELAADDDAWEAITWLAGIIEGVVLDGVEVMQIVEADTTTAAAGR
jgi:hypothetical protein